MKREEKQSEQNQGDNHTVYLGNGQSPLWTERRRERKAGLEDRKHLGSHSLPLPKCHPQSQRLAGPQAGLESFLHHKPWGSPGEIAEKVTSDTIKGAAHVKLP